MAKRQKQVRWDIIKWENIISLMTAPFLGTYPDIQGLNFFIALKVVFMIYKVIPIIEKGITSINIKICTARIMILKIIHLKFSGFSKISKTRIHLLYK